MKTGKAPIPTLAYPAFLACIDLKARTTRWDPPRRLLPLDRFRGNRCKRATLF